MNERCRVIPGKYKLRRISEALLARGNTSPLVSFLCLVLEITSGVTQRSKNAIRCDEPTAFFFVSCLRHSCDAAYICGVDWNKESVFRHRVFFSNLGSCASFCRSFLFSPQKKFGNPDHFALTETKIDALVLSSPSVISSRRRSRATKAHARVRVSALF